VQLQPIDFAGVVRACGVPGWQVADPRLAGDVLKEAFEQPGPALVEAVVDPNEPPLPGKLTTDQAWQFVKALAKGQPDR